MQKHNRDLYWDVAKGIAIILVLVGHSIQCIRQDCFDDKLYQFIYSFHMPLFMFISGWFFYYSMRKYELVELVDKKIRSICIPLFVFGVILFPIFFDFNASIGTIIKNYILSIGILWFLVQVLYCMVAMTLVCRIFTGKWGG